MAKSNVSAEKDPCTAESMKSMQCLQDNDYNRAACKKDFDNYNACKKFWGSVYIARKRAGIVPYLPPHQDRQAMKVIYAKTGKIPTTPDG